MLLKNEWTEEQLLEIFCTFRHIFSHQKKYNKIIREIDGFVNTVSTLNFKNLQENILKLDDYMDISYISNIKENLDIFLNEIRKTTDAIRKTKN